MKKLIAAAGLFVMLLTGTGCGSGAESARIEPSRPAASRNAQNNGAQEGVERASNAEPVPANSNAQSEGPLAAARSRKLDAMRKSANAAGPIMDIENILRQSTRPAPENSEFAVALTETLVERRSFNNHRILSRVEKVTDGERKSISVITTDGRKFDLPGNAIESLSTVPSAAILKLLNIEPPRPINSKTKTAAPSKTNSN